MSVSMFLELNKIQKIHALNSQTIKTLEKGVTIKN